jgi:5-methylcytosine-specific restriction endonuclease McrA
MGKVITKCIICSAEICDWPSRKRKVCSKECEKKYISTHLKEKFKRGEIFGTEHRANISKALKTSEKAKRTQFKGGSENPAYGRNQTGSANANWKGGITGTNQKKRNDPRMKEWRRSVFERDSYTCQDCGAKGYLQAHHLTPLSVDLTKAFDIENGKTVCVECHEKIHGRFIGKFKQKA